MNVNPEYHLEQLLKEFILQSTLPGLAEITEGGIFAGLGSAPLSTPALGIFCKESEEDDTTGNWHCSLEIKPLSAPDAAAQHVLREGELRQLFRAADIEAQLDAVAIEKGNPVRLQLWGPGSKMERGKNQADEFVSTITVPVEIYLSE